MTLILSVIIISYFLIGMEAIVPGGILGILGFIGLVIATYFSAQEFGGWFAFRYLSSKWHGGFIVAFFRI